MRDNDLASLSATVDSSSAVALVSSAVALVSKGTRASAREWKGDGELDMLMESQACERPPS